MLSSYTMSLVVSYSLKQMLQDEMSAFEDQRAVGLVKFEDQSRL